MCAVVGTFSQEVMLRTFSAPQVDSRWVFGFLLPFVDEEGAQRFKMTEQVLMQHETYEIICEDTNRNITQSDEVVVIQVCQQGRNAEQKQKLYAAPSDQRG